MDLCLELKANLPRQLCQEIIERFEKDPRRFQGVTGSGLNTGVKSSTDLMFSRYEDWDDVNKQLDDILRKNMQVYQKFLESKFPMMSPMLSTAWHSGYQIQKSGHYVWHQDSAFEYGRQRVLTFIWYLNTIEEGGGTGFMYKTVQPETGKCVMFPATWNYVHCGFPAVNKYIVTGWLWQEVDH